MTQRKKMMAFLTVFLGMLAAIAPLSTDMYLPALPFMMEDFSVTPSMIQLTLTASMAGMAAGQIIAAPTWVGASPSSSAWPYLPCLR